jgi:hypothetical protein
LKMGEGSGFLVTVRLEAGGLLRRRGNQRAAAVGVQLVDLAILPRRDAE